MGTFTADQIATACADADISDSKCESLMIALHYTPQTPALAVERASKLLLLYEMQLTTLQPPLRERVAAMIEAMKEMGL